MTTKQAFLRAIELFPDDITLDEAFERLYLVRKILIGIQQADAGECMDHDEFGRELFGRSK